MTTIIVKAFDPDEKGSYRFKKATMQAIAKLRAIQSDADGDGVYALAEATLAVSELLESRMRTDDDSPLEDALADLSENQFQSLLSGSLQETKPTIPNPSSRSSKGGRRVKTA